MKMKKIFFIHLILFLFSYSFLHSQSSPPELISYQGIARDAAGNILPNQPIGIQLIIHQGSTGGPPVFTEQHSVTTNSLGLFYLQIGANNPSAFQAIPWNNGPYFLELLIDPTGGSSYTSIGTQQILSVPYALYAKDSYSSTVSFHSYSTTNAPPIVITTNTSSSSITLNITQGSNTATVTLNLSNLFWSKNGDTISSSNYIGTNNSNDFIIKTNNTERMRINANGQVVVNSNTISAGNVFSTYAAGTDAAINGYSSGSGEAVYAQNTGSGYTILGITTNTNPAVYGQGPNIGTYGFATANNGTGIFGVGASTVTADGVTGIAKNSQAMGGVFWNSHTSGTGLLVGGNNVAMNHLPNGSGIAATSTTFGIVSFATNAASGNGIAAAGNNLGIIDFPSGGGGTFHGQTFGVYGIAASNTNNTWGGYFSNGNANGYVFVGGIDNSGTSKKIVGPGSVSTIVKDLEDNPVLMTCPEAPEILLEDLGVGQLINGKAHIEIDPIFAKNIVVNDKHPLRVLIQIEGECNGVYVTNKTQKGFDVIELNNGKSNVSFTYHIFANRADDIDKNGNIISKNTDIRFSPAPRKLTPSINTTNHKKILKHELNYNSKK